MGAILREVVSVDNKKKGVLTFVHLCWYGASRVDATNTFQLEMGKQWMLEIEYNPRVDIVGFLC